MYLKVLYIRISMSLGGSTTKVSQQCEKIKVDMEGKNSQEGTYLLKSYCNCCGGVKSYYSSINGHYMYYNRVFGKWQIGYSLCDDENGKYLIYLSDLSI